MALTSIVFFSPLANVHLFSEIHLLLSSEQQNNNLLSWFYPLVDVKDYQINFSLFILLRQPLHYTNTSTIDVIHSVFQIFTYSSSKLDPFCSIASIYQIIHFYSIGCILLSTLNLIFSPISDAVNWAMEGGGFPLPVFNIESEDEDEIQSRELPKYQAKPFHHHLHKLLSDRSLCLPGRSPNSVLKKLEHVAEDNLLKKDLKESVS